MNSHSPITLETKIVQAEGLEEAMLEDQVVMMSVEKGKYFALDSVASRIWPMIERPRTVRQVCDDLLPRYEADQETVQREVLDFIEDLRRCEVIRIVEE